MEKKLAVLVDWRCRHDGVFDMPIEIQGKTLTGEFLSVSDIEKLDLDTGFAETESMIYKLVGKGSRMILVDIEDYNKWWAGAFEEEMAADDYGQA